MVHVWFLIHVIMMSMMRAGLQNLMPAARAAKRHGEGWDIDAMASCPNTAVPVLRHSPTLHAHALACMHERHLLRFHEKAVRAVHTCTAVTNPRTYVWGVCGADTCTSLYVEGNVSRGESAD